MIDDLFVNHYSLIVNQYMRKHLAIMSKATIEAILSGKKTIETRFSHHKIVPFGAVSKGDLVYLKPPGEEIIGQFKVKKVISYEGLTPTDVQKIYADYGKEIRTGQEEVDDKYFNNKQESSYGTLIFITESERFITSPLKVKKKDLRGWMVLS